MSSDANEHMALRSAVIEAQDRFKLAQDKFSALMTLIVTGESRESLREACQQFYNQQCHFISQLDRLIADAQRRIENANSYAFPIDSLRNKWQEALIAEIEWASETRRTHIAAKENIRLFIESSPNT